MTRAQGILITVGILAVAYGVFHTASPEASPRSFEPPVKVLDSGFNGSAWAGCTIRHEHPEEAADLTGAWWCPKRVTIFDCGDREGAYVRGIDLKTMSCHEMRLWNYKHEI